MNMNKVIIQRMNRDNAGNQFSGCLSLFWFTAAFYDLPLLYGGDRGRGIVLDIEIEV